MYAREKIRENIEYKWILRNLMKKIWKIKICLMENDERNLVNEDMLGKK